MWLVGLDDVLLLCGHNNRAFSLRKGACEPAETVLAARIVVFVGRRVSRLWRRLLHELSQQLQVLSARVLRYQRQQKLGVLVHRT